MMGALQRAKRKLVPLHQKLARRLHDLDYLFIEITQRCNLRCLHCGSDCTRSSTVPDLAGAEIIGVLEEISQEYEPGKITVVLSGGEPLCYPGLFELGRRISRMGFPWGMVTNGLAWSREKVRKARAAGIRTVTVSLDGLEGSHDWLRGRKGSFHKASDAIRLLLDEGFLDAMDVVTCVNRRNLDELSPLHAHLTELGVPAWRLFTISPIGRATEHEELFLDPGRFQSLMAWIIELRGRPGTSVAYSPCAYLGPRFEGKASDGYFFCRAGINVAGIMVNGDILACPNIDRRFAQGNIRSAFFPDVWEEEYEEFRDRSWMKRGPCETCGEWAMCQGGCFHLRDFETRTTKLCHARAFQLI